MKAMRLILMAVLAAAWLLPPASAVQAQTDQPPSSMPGTPAYLRADPTPSDVRVPLPEWLRSEISRPNLVAVVPESGGARPTTVPFARPESLDSFRFVVRFNNVPPDGTCQGPLGPWPAQAMDAFVYAVRIWASILNGGQRIDIDACWHRGMVDADTLAFTKPVIDYRDFTNAPIAGTWYPVALANQLGGNDFNGSNAEITATFINAWDWYYGTDGNPSATQYDLVSVALHELGHGLGFLSGFGYACGTTCTGGWGDYPRAYDRLVQNGSGQVLVASFDNNSAKLGAQLVSANLFFGGAQTRAANGGKPPKLYAPATWDGGSSVSHLDETTFNGTQSALMTPAFSVGEAIHYPGPVGLAILADIGWSVPNLASTYVNRGNTSGAEDGSQSYPFNTITEGVNAVAVGGTVYITAGTYVEQVTIPPRPMTVRATGGVVIIGR